MTLSRTLSWTFTLGFIALSLGLASDSSAFNENHWMHRRVAQEFCVGSSCWKRLIDCAIECCWMKRP